MSLPRNRWAALRSVTISCCSMHGVCTQCTGSRTLAQRLLRPNSITCATTDGPKVGSSDMLPVWHDQTSSGICTAPAAPSTTCLFGMFRWRCCGRSGLDVHQVRRDKAARPVRRMAACSQRPCVFCMHVFCARAFWPLPCNLSCRLRPRYRRCVFSVTQKVNRSQSEGHLDPAQAT